MIDFSNAEQWIRFWIIAWIRNFRLCFARQDFRKSSLQKAEKAAEKTAVLKSANMSLGINLLLKLLKDAAKVLAPAGYDIELVEKHHNQKLDAPSGTALALADSVNEALETNIIMYMTEALSARNVMQKKSEFQLFAEVRS